MIKRFLSLLGTTYTLSGCFASEAVIDFSDIKEKKSEMVSSREIIARNEAATEEYQFLYEGREFVVYPHVYSPKIFPSTFYYSEYLNITPGQSFLEIGSGTGLLTIFAALQGANPVVATDISPLAVANTAENSRRYDLNAIVDVREGNVFDPIKEGETFDIIFWNVPYMHIDKTDLSPIEIALYDPCYRGLTRFFAEAKKYLKPDGKLLFGSSSTHMHQDVLQKLVSTYGWSMRVIADKTVTLPPVEGGASALNVQLCETVPIQNNTPQRMMNTTIENQQSNWLTYVKERSAETTAQQFNAKDSSGRSITIQWQATDILSPDLATFKKNISELACQVLTPIEVEFLQAHPEAVTQEMFLNPCAPFFENGVEAVDWEAVKEKIGSTIRQFYLIDLASFGPAVIKPLLDDVYFPVTIKDSETETVLGFAMFAVTPALPFGNVKLINVAVIPEEKDKGLDQLMMSSIFKILPKTQRIFTFTRPTNVQALETYCSWGFAQDLNPVQDPNHKVNLDYLRLLEYKAEASTVLQKRAEMFVAQ